MSSFISHTACLLRDKRIVLVLLFVVISIGVWLAWRRTAAEENINTIPRQTLDEGFVSSDTCRTCHADEYKTWHDSYHRTMTQVASPQTVVAPFDNIQLEAHDRTYYLSRRGDEFWVRMIDPDWEEQQLKQGVDSWTNPPMVERKVLLTTGSHHQQTYWIGTDQGNRLANFPWHYNIKDNRWVPRQDVFLRPSHHGREFPVWNSSCILCHAVAGKPRVDSETGRMDSTVVELGITCEACHGPGQAHVSFHNTATGDMRDDPIINPSKCSPKIASEICGQCHSSFFERAADVSTNGIGYRAGGEFSATHDIIRPGDQREGFVDWGHWQDGTCRVGGDEFNGLIKSPCAERGALSCLSCHSLHDSDPNDQLASGMDGNEACLQCHDDFRQRIEEHTHHQPGSSGSLCYNCHMPYTSYALFTAMRSHRISTPQVHPSKILNAQPNGCNLCHLDKTLQWTSRHLADWYGTQSIELTKEEREVAASLLWLTRGNAAHRAITAWHMGWNSAHDASSTGWQAPHLATLLDDPYVAIRYLAHGSLKTLPRFRHFEFDFLSSPQELVNSRQRALDIWSRDPDKLERAGDMATLIKADGTLDQLKLNQLLRQRDNTPVVIPE